MPLDINNPSNSQRNDQIGCTTAETDQSGDNSDGNEQSGVTGKLSSSRFRQKLVQLFGRELSASTLNSTETPEGRRE